MDFQTTKVVSSLTNSSESWPTISNPVKNDIQTAGYTKCRFPVLAKRYVVRDGEVLYADLSTLKTIEE